MTAPNRAQREAWNGDSGSRSAADADRRDRILAPIAEELLSAAALTGGANVLDVGCGCGATTLAAAERCADALNAIAGPDGVWLGAGINLITATRP